MSKRKESEVWAHINVLEDTPHLAKCASCSTKIARGKIDGPKKSYSVKGLWDHITQSTKRRINLQKLTRIPSEKVVITTLMPKLYREVQKELFETLSLALKDGHYSVPCDVWSSLALDSYLGLTVHFITEDFVRKMLVLRCLLYNKAHTGESIQGRVEFVLEQWGHRVDELHCIVFFKKKKKKASAFITPCDTR